MNIKKIFMYSVAGAVFFGAGVAYAQVYQPYMASALSLLEQAREQLVLAEADKGGYRVQAIAYVDQAIASVRAGIAVSTP